MQGNPRKHVYREADKPFVFMLLKGMFTNYVYLCLTAQPIVLANIPVFDWD